MDVDPELDVTLSNGRHLVTFQIAALDRDLGTWTVAEPVVPRRVILGDAEALDVRRRLDARIAARLAAGWVPVDPRPGGTAARPLPADLQLYLAVCENSIMALRGLAFVELEETTEALMTRNRGSVDDRRPGHDEFVAETLVRPFFMIMLHKEIGQPRGGAARRGAPGALSTRTWPIRQSVRRTRSKWDSMRVGPGVSRRCHAADGERRQCRAGLGPG